MTPSGQAVVLEALRFDRIFSIPAGLTDRDWKHILAYCDRFQLTLTFARCIRPHNTTGSVPAWVWDRLRRNAAANRARHAQFVELYRTFSKCDHLLLKGFAHYPFFCPDPELRTQYDLDLYCPLENIEAARDIALGLGYQPLDNRDRFPTDHLSPMIRKTGWEWKEDYFDLDIPIAIEIHFRFWDRGAERFGPRSLNGFWQRRCVRQWRDVPFISLDEADSLAYACLHALRHLLRGDPRPGQFHEIAWFLERQRDPAFWQPWKTRHDEALHRIQAICFRFAELWFGCRLPAAARETVDALPPSVHSWFDTWGRSPLEAPFRPNKDELWLHLCLLESLPDKAAVLRRRLIPLKPPGPVDAVHIPEERMTWPLRVRRAWRYLQYTAGRALHHTRVLLPTAAAGLRWWMSQRDLSPEFWRFFRAGIIFNSALMIFYLLYNLHLISLGLREDFVGSVTSAMIAGSLLGSLAAGVIVTRIGLHRSLLFCFLSTGAACALRVLFTSQPALLAFAFAGGICQSFWAVSLAPTVAALTTERSRPFAFSLTFASGVGIGIVAGIAGGRLPAVLHSTQNALWLACALAPLAALPILRLRIPLPAANSARTYAANPFLIRFLAALALWGLATGAFNPFFNVFFARAMHWNVEKIGVFFSLAQFAQVVAMLLSPFLLKRLGQAPAIALMQGITGLALAGLGFATPAFAGYIYAAYTAFQYMSEPGMYSLLMTRVAAENRTGASALNFVVLFAAQALAAWLAGGAITRFGYSPVLWTAAGMAMLAAWAMTLATRSR